MTPILPHYRLPALFTALLLSLGAAPASQPFEDPHEPHTPTLIYYLTDATTSQDVDAIRAAIAQQKSASVVEVNTTRSYARIRVDSHVTGYHQIAQSLADAGNSLHKKYDPTLLFLIPDYPAHAKEVDAIFAAKRLNTRVHLIPVDKSKGLFALHFLPLTVDPASIAVQGFNGGHIHHPISDPKPHGLAIPSYYASNDNPALYPPPTTQPAAAPQ